MEIRMSDQKRIDAVQAASDGRLEKGRCSEVLGVTIRQVNRLIETLRVSGIAGLIHGNRGQVSPRQTPKKIQDQILDLVRGRYKDINDTHLMEILMREEKIKIGRETLRVLLRSNGMGPKRKRRGRKFRSRRERKEAFGCMIQIDASIHDWLEGRGPMLTLVGGKDDATGYVWARFEYAETSWAYLHLIQDIANTHGLPMSLYSDRHGIFHVMKEPTIVAQFQNTAPLTQFGRAMQDLGIQLIKAWSSQAKGRIERHWGFSQDRLVVEMRLANAKTIEDANRVLATFLKEHNARYTVPPRQREPMFRKPPHLHTLNRILCLKETRTVAKDNTISFEGIILQIPHVPGLRSLAQRKVEVLQLRDGSIEIQYEKKTVAKFNKDAVARLAVQNRKENSQLKRAA
jgi:transposase